MRERTPRHADARRVDPFRIPAHPGGQGEAAHLPQSVFIPAGNDVSILTSGSNDEVHVKQPVFVNAKGKVALQKSKYELPTVVSKLPDGHG